MLSFPRVAVVTVALHSNGTLSKTPPSPIPLSRHRPSLETLYAEAGRQDNRQSVFLHLYDLSLGVESLLPFTLTHKHTVATPVHISTGLFLRSWAQEYTASAGRCQTLCCLLVYKPSLQQWLLVLWLHASPVGWLFVFLPNVTVGLLCWLISCLLLWPAVFTNDTLGWAVAAFGRRLPGSQAVARHDQNWLLRQDRSYFPLLRETKCLSYI